ncbi:hypothetical protein Poli38472_005858 [Pythium oligandrum]|uniref:Uncharacterized protein n=1 Tax=Pythium oligandrum TaxID=41045 RepID=A0A8K1CTH3_PYTOL|nr:hypothetical protein Poli38472_005858 [Pythium oligandrum]|eukprot:TMW68390.1 hypothetical protein Poli38472_005858 [Pythium oligandrum]
MPMRVWRASHALQRSTALPWTSQGLISRRHFHATNQQPIWYVAVGLGFTGLYLGSRYVMRAQERMRRREAGLPEEDDEDEYEGDYTERRRIDRILGLDVGSASLRLATASPFSSTPARVIESAEGLRAIPAAVAVDNDTELVGTLAKSLQGRKPRHTATATRLLLGRSTESIAADDFVKTLPYTIDTSGERVTMELDGKEYSTEWAAEVMLDHLHSVASRSLGQDHDGFPAVITTPASADERQRVALERLAVAAGFDLVSSVEEPVAALHAVEELVEADDEDEDVRQALQSGKPIAVFDMGGYVSSFSLLQRQPSGYSIVSTQSTTGFSGALVDRLLFQRVVDKFYQEVGIDLSIDHLASYRILEAVETAKHELSTRKSTDLNLPFITADQSGAKHLVQKLSSYDLARVLEKPMRDALTLCDAVLKDSGITKQDVAALVLIGGGVRSDFVRTELERFFNTTAFASKDFRPEEAVVVGAAEFGRKLIMETE